MSRCRPDNRVHTVGESKFANEAVRVQLEQLDARPNLKASPAWTATWGYTHLVFSDCSFTAAAVIASPRPIF